MTGEEIKQYVHNVEDGIALENKRYKEERNKELSKLYNFTKANIGSGLELNKTTINVSLSDLFSSENITMPFDILN